MLVMRKACCTLPRSLGFLSIDRRKPLQKGEQRGRNATFQKSMRRQSSRINMSSQASNHQHCNPFWNMERSRRQASTKWAEASQIARTQRQNCLCHGDSVHTTVVFSVTQPGHSSDEVSTYRSGWSWSPNLERTGNWICNQRSRITYLSRWVSLKIIGLVVFALGLFM